jgi:alkylated DNA repair dioxygenase AlkB
MNTPSVTIIQNFYGEHEKLFTILASSIEWDDRMAARRTASFGKPYNYSQIDYREAPIPPYFDELLQRLHHQLGIVFNNCLLNYYETGDNTMGFHSDDTSGWIDGTGVAIVSLGSVREITYKQKANPENQVSYPLNPGSLLYMDDAVQQNWLHAIKRQRDVGPRISLTWRAFQ